MTRDVPFPTEERKGAAADALHRRLLTTAPRHRFDAVDRHSAQGGEDSSAPPDRQAAGAFNTAAETARTPLPVAAEHEALTHG